MYIKCVLKPVFVRIKQLEEAGQDKTIPGAVVKQDSSTQATTRESLSDHELEDDESQEQEVGEPLTHASSYAEVTSPQKKKGLSVFTNDYIFDMSLNYVFEILLTISP